MCIGGHLVHMEYEAEVRDAGRVRTMAIEAVCTAFSRGSSGARSQVFPLASNIAEAVWSGRKRYTGHDETARYPTGRST